MKNPPKPPRRKTGDHEVHGQNQAMWYGNINLLVNQTVIMKFLLLLVLLLALVGFASAGLIQVNVSEKSLVIAGETPNFYGVVKSNTSAYYVTETSTSLSKTLEKLNSIAISSNLTGTWSLASINVNNGIIE